MNVFIKTYGCQMNARDSEAAGALLRRYGYGVASTEDEADVVIVNTCSVRGKAEQKALGKLGLLVSGRRERPDRFVGAVGCMVQRLGESLFEKVPGLDFAVGTHRLACLPDILDRVRSVGGPVLDVSDEAVGPESLAHHLENRVSAFVNILFGCNRRCSYCIVPSVRGREWSRPAARVLEEVRTLAGNGCREVTLLGQSVMAYGRSNPVWEDGHGSPRGFTEPFARLLEAVGGISGIGRIRFTSGHPVGCSPELVRAMAEIPSVAPHLHLPMQSGSDRMLRAMRRGYTVDDYRRAVSRLRDAVPRLAVSTDIIVGFPGESRDDFEATRCLMDEIGFDNAFIFKYSPRPGTPAEALRDDVDEDEKLRRNKVLLADQERRTETTYRGLVGQTESVLAEGPSARNAARWSGRTGQNRTVVFEPDKRLHLGEFISVLIRRAMPQTLYGEIVRNGDRHG